MGLLQATYAMGVIRVTRVTETKSEFGKLIDGTIDELREHLVGKDIGYAHSLRVLMGNIYVQFTALKDQYMEKRNESSDENVIKELDNKIDCVYSELFKIEEKAQYLADYEELHKIT